jgi:hypothetical protein
VSLRDRLQRLEAGLPPGCPTCRDWPRCRVVFGNDWDDERREPTVPERCPRCGREPVTIAVEYVVRPPEGA